MFAFQIWLCKYKKRKEDLKKFNQQTTQVMKNEEGTYKQGKFLSNKLSPRDWGWTRWGGAPKGLGVDPVRGSAQGTGGGPGEGERPRD